MKRYIFFFVVSFCLSACAKLPIDPALVNRKVEVKADSITFAVIGDFGLDSPEEAAVAAMVKTWKPDFIITTGDNNYPTGGINTIEANIGKHYGDFIYNPDAPQALLKSGLAATEKVNRFFPCPGNHDNYSLPALQPYLDYFSLPGDEKNYEFSWGPARFFSLNTGKFGNLDCCDGVEAKWLQQARARSQVPFNFVFFHHPPFSTGGHGSKAGMQWPFTAMGFDAVFNGHDHIYERLTESNTLPAYFVVGNSGNPDLYSCTANSVDTGRFAVFCDDKHHGALRVKVNKQVAVLEYFTTAQQSYPTDVFVIQK